MKKKHVWIPLVVIAIACWAGYFTFLTINAHLKKESRAFTDLAFITGKWMAMDGSRDFIKIEPAGYFIWPEGGISLEKDGWMLEFIQRVSINQGGYNLYRELWFTNHGEYWITRSSDRKFPVSDTIRVRESEKGTLLILFPGQNRWMRYTRR